ncbi:MAG: histidine kinase [Propionibacteriaceae bacterium]|nr:histidine kinase [Propionibacteriaceae bacterium]
MLLFITWRVPALQDTTEVFFHWMVFTLAWSFGFGLSTLERRARESTQRAINVEVSASQQTMAAIAAERARIARELHDVVAHSVSVMVVQAGAAREMVDDDTDYVRSALESIRTTGTGALTELRRVLEVLRADGEPGALTPQPGADGLGALVEDASRGGLAVVLVVEGRPHTLPAGLDLAIYRIVQEALTNVRRHASATRARVLLSYADDHVAVEVRDDGVGMAPSSLVDGHGLIGMRERTDLYGGHLETQSDGGFTVRAVLPMASP